MNGWLVEQLPGSLASDDLMRRFVGLFEGLAEETLLGVGGIEHAVDPAVAPDAMVRWLGGWLGLDHLDAEMPPAHQRDLVRGGGAVLAWRGTATGLEALIELAFGVEATVTDAGGVFPERASPSNPNQVWVSLADAGWASEERVVELIRAEVPADVTVEVRIAGELRWPRPSDRTGPQDA